MSREWFQNDSLFREQLAKGHDAAARVAQRLEAAGLEGVSLTPMQVRETIEQRGRFANEVDLRVGVRRPARLEVKSTSRPFTCPEDFPFDPAYVDTVSGWKQKNPKPHAVVLISQKTGAVAVVPCSTEPWWGKRLTYDRLRKIEDTIYTVPREFLCTFDELIGWLKKREG